MLGSRHLIAVLVAATASLAASSAAWADSAREQAAKHVVEGDKLKERAENAAMDSDARILFQEAAEQYQAAYELVPHPLMLYNTAQVLRLAGDDEEALQYYEDYLATDPTGDTARFARKYVDVLERKIKASKGSQVDRDPDTQPPDKDLDLGDVDEPEEGGEDEVQGSQTSISTGTSDPGTSTLRYAGYGSIALGVVGLGLGIKYGLDGQRIAKDIETVTDADEWFALDEQGKKANSNQLLFLSAGGALVVLGGVLYYVGANDDSKEADGISWAPQLSASEVGFALGGRF